MNQQTGKILLVIGLIVIAAGIVVYFFHDYLKWMGRLPGDIRIEKEKIRLYFPVTTMILLSIIISLILYFIKKSG